MGEFGSPNVQSSVGRDDVGTEMPFLVEKRFIAEAEKQLGVKFPIDYVMRMMNENGGDVSSSHDSFMLFPIFDSSDKKRLKRTCNDVVRETKSAYERPGFPRDAVAIRSSGGGDLLILLRDKNVPETLGEEVYWWDHETDKHRVELWRTFLAPT